MSILAAYNARHEKDAIDIDQNHPSPRSGALQPLAIAEKAADDLAEKRIEGNDGKDVTWISTVIEGVEEISWTISLSVLIYIMAMQASDFYELSEPLRKTAGDLLAYNRAVCICDSASVE